MSITITLKNFVKDLEYYKKESEEMSDFEKDMLGLSPRKLAYKKICDDNKYTEDR